MNTPALRAELWAHGRRHMQAGEWAQALQVFQTMAAEHAAIDEYSVPLLLQLSTVYLRLDQYQNAHRSAMAAAALRPSDPGQFQSTANAMNVFGEPGELARLVDASAAFALPPSVLADTALLLSAFGMHARAVALLDRLDSASANAPHAKYVRGLIDMFEGRTAQAELEFKGALQRAPTLAHVHWLLSQVDAIETKSEHAAAMLRLRVQDIASDAAEAYIAYALHNELYDLQRDEEAWSALERGCRAKLRMASYDAVATERLFSALKALCTADFVRPAVLDDPLTPIFIIGMHRSGTTLLERILAGHSQVADGGESSAFRAQVRWATDHVASDLLDIETIDRLADADFVALGRRYLESVLWRARGKPFLTEKLPSNLVYAGFIAKALPQAKILHMVRDPMDTCWSNLRTHFAGAAPYSYDQVQMADYYGQYAALMRHWKDVMPVRVLDVSYDALVHSPEATARDIFEFCGLPFEESALNVERSSGAVATASSVLVRRGIRTDRGAAWRRYERHLQPLQTRLRELGFDV
ncbi:MAG: sulfotransferase [Luteimonas sp.]